ncbi:MAG: polysaccharide deacetylase family protein [Candidatus Wallbacteria bacterium]|nr:polysaccharide deacetylase family protein [Candidatus Wallbacteria bacterium]
MKLVFLLLILSLPVFAVPMPDFEGLLHDYRDYHLTLGYFSEQAHTAEVHTNRAYQEIYITGHYLHQRETSISLKIKDTIISSPEVTILFFKEMLGKEGAGENYLIFRKFIDLNLLVLKSMSSESAGEIMEILKKNGNFKGSRIAFLQVDRIIKETEGNFTEEQAPAGKLPGKYCEVKYVKGKTPFLVQYDDFLKSGEIILTFDDGPTPVGNYTADICKTLKENSFPSIFFVLGVHLERQTGLNLLLSEKDTGAVAGVHGYWHATPDDRPLTAYDWATIKDQLSKTMSQIEGNGQNPVFFRPPYGIVRDTDLNSIRSELDLIPVGWTIDSQDWSIKSPKELFANITKQITKRKKGILLMHDIHPQSREVLSSLCKWLKANNYSVVSPQKLVDAFSTHDDESL